MTAMPDDDSSRRVVGTTERVGTLEMRMAVAQASPEADERWAHRGEGLAQWLVEAWRREHAETSAPSGG